MKTYYSTFGWGSPYQDKYVEVHAESMTAAMAKMFEKFGKGWSIICMQEQFAGQAERYELTKLEVNWD
jgi:hypothetical protein